MIRTLQKQTLEGMTISISQRPFLPTNKLDEIFTRNAIDDAVKELACDPQDRIKLVDTIYNEGKRVFAMLVYDDCQNLITKFRKFGFLDSQLPLSEVDITKIADTVPVRRLARDTQWHFCPYIFPERMWQYHRELNKEIILPIINAVQIGTGAYGDVEKIGLPSCQQNIIATKEQIVQFARKRLKTKAMTEEFKREEKCLRLLNQLKHPNIIPLFGSYTYQGEQNFLFPYIEMSLDRFLLSKSRYGDFQWDFTFYSALAGLASALSKTHRLNLSLAVHDVTFEGIGYHHDLRPPNVLVSPDTFILTDFGLGRLKWEEALSHTPFKSVSGDYIAPECTNGNEEGQAVGRSVDVWALGCLIIEVVTYMLKGNEGLEVFRKKRLTPGRLERWQDSSFHQPSGHVKQEVLDWIGDLSRTNSEPDLVPQLIEISRQALTFESKERPNMDAIYQRLTRLSMQKHFQSIQSIFRSVLETVELSASHNQHYLQSIRYAQQRFDVWGIAALREDNVSDFNREESVAIMKRVFKELKPKAEVHGLGDGRLIVQSINDLWNVLPDSLHQSAENQWEKAVDDIEPFHEKEDSHLVTRRDSSDALGLESEFEEAARVFKRSFRDSIPWDELLGVTSSQSVYTITEKIQDEQAAYDGLRNLPKIHRYLEHLEGYAGVICDIVHGNQQILALVWGPIALLLKWATVQEKAFDSLINAVAEIGKVLPDFRASPSIFDQNTEALEITLLLFKDLLNFYHEALEAFTHPNWMHVFDRLWPKHHTHILEIASHIGRLARLMRIDIRLEHIQQEHEFRKTALESFKEQKRESRQQEFDRIRTSFNPRNYDNALDQLRGCSRFRQPGDWLFRDEVYVEWLNSSQEDKQVLWLRGIPGAGKSVLCSAVISHLMTKPAVKTAFAFLTYRETKVTALSTMHSLVFQLAEKDDDAMAIICESMANSSSNNLTAVGDLLSSLANYTAPSYIVIDGVDEIREGERDRLVSELLRQVAVCKRLRLILSSRPEADLIRLLRKKTVIHIHDRNEDSIKNYVENRCQSFFSERRVLPAIRTEILKLLSPLPSRAKGMFLYARLIIDMVETMNDLYEMRRELTVLPESLDDAYYRIITRLRNHKDKRLAEKARRLLGWIACTSASITVEEAEQALVVQPDDRDQEYTMIAKLDIIAVLGPIVETVENYIRFVHFTAKEYICSPHLGTQLIDTTQATLDLATRCINYLCQRHHDLNLPREEYSKKICSGQYRFHAFSAKMWFELVCQYLQSIGSANPSVHLIESLQKMCEIRLAQVESEDGSGIEVDNEALFEPLREKQPLLYQVLCKASRFRRSSFLFTGRANRDPNKVRRDPFSISDTSRIIYQAFNTTLCDNPFIIWDEFGSPSQTQCHENCALILWYYGPRPFKCKFPQCDIWQRGLPTRHLRDRHERLHDNPLKCHVSGCAYGEIGFLSESMRVKHLRETHSTHPPPQGIDTHNLPQADVAAVLSDLVKENQLDAVATILCALPLTSEMHKTRRELSILAASSGTKAMLQLLLEPHYLNGIDKKGACLRACIESCNENTLSYLTEEIRPFSVDIYGTPNQHTMEVALLMSKDWHAGVKIWSKWLRSGLDSIARRQWERYRATNDEFGNPSIIRAAASHPNGNQQLLYLWRNSGVVPVLGRSWLNGTLRTVAGTGFSIPLAEYLLQQGAEINNREGQHRATALQRAAKSTSFNAARMMEFLLLNGADPDVDYGANHRRVHEEAGAKGIHRWIDKTWDELVEETKRLRSGREVVRALISEIGEEDQIDRSD